MKFRGKFAALLGLTQIIFIVLFAVFVEYDKTANPFSLSSNESDIEHENSLFTDHYLSLFQDIHVMVFFGIGFLYTFMKKYGYTGLSMSILLAAVSVETALLIQNVWNTESYSIRISLVSLIMSEFAAASALIALGGIFGKVSALQMVFFVIFETIFYSLNEHLCITLLQINDLGESVALHMFAGLFGLAVAYIVDKGKEVDNNPNDSTSYMSNIFCLLGTVFLFAYWPSFNCALATGASQQRSAISTFLALIASCVATFAASSALNRDQKFYTSHIQNATLAGGVAIGAVANLAIGPAVAIAIGGLGGVISVLGFKFASPFLNTYMKIYDPCGINSLHAIPGAFSGIVAAIVAVTASEVNYGKGLYNIYPAMAPKANTTALLDIQSQFPDVVPGLGRTALTQTCYQLAYVVTTAVIAVVTGLVTGMILRMSIFDPLKEDEMYTDEIFWDLPKEVAEDNQSRKDNQVGMTNF